MSVAIAMLFLIFICYRTPSDAFIKGCLILFGLSIVALIMSQKLRDDLPENPNKKKKGEDK